MNSNDNTGFYIHKQFNYETLTYDEMLAKNLAVMDNAALSLCINTNIELRVFNMSDLNNFARVIQGENIGTTITKGE